MRMAIDFKRDDHVIRTVTLEEAIPNLAIGQYMTFDHPSTKLSCFGVITKISHVVFLSPEKPITYVDVEVQK